MFLVLDNDSPVAAGPVRPLLLLVRCILSVFGEAPARVPNIECNRRYSDGNAVQADEKALRPQYMIFVAPSVGELGDTVAASDENAEVRNPECNQEHSEHSRASEICRGWIQMITVAIR